LKEGISFKAIVLKEGEVQIGDPLPASDNEIGYVWPEISDGRIRNAPQLIAMKMEQ